MIRDLQDARRRRDQVRQQLTRVRSDAGALAPQSDEIEKRWDAINREVAALRYNQILDAPATADDVRDVLRAGEAIGQILVGADESFGFFVDAGSETIAEVLRDAQKKMIARPLSHPKAWAGFSLVGDGVQRLTRKRIARASLPTTSVSVTR